MEDERTIEKLNGADEQPDSEKVSLTVERYVPENLVAQYADGMTVLHSKNEFIVSFYLTEYPAAATPEELAALTKLRGKCVSRIIMSPQKMAEVIEVLQGNMDKYRNSYQQEGS